MGNRQKRKAKLAQHIAERKAEAIAFPSKYAQKTQVAAKPASRPWRLYRAALVVLSLLIAGAVGFALVVGGVNMILSHSPQSSTHMGASASSSRPQR